MAIVDAAAAGRSKQEWHRLSTMARRCNGAGPYRFRVRLPAWRGGHRVQERCGSRSAIPRASPCSGSAVRSGTGDTSPIRSVAQAVCPGSAFDGVLIRRWRVIGGGSSSGAPLGPPRRARAIVFGRTIGWIYRFVYPRFHFGHFVFPVNRLSIKSADGFFNCPSLSAAARNALPPSCVGLQRGAVTLPPHAAPVLAPVLPQKGWGLRILAQQPNGTPGKTPPAPSVKILMSKKPPRQTRQADEVDQGRGAKPVPVRRGRN